MHPLYLTDYIHRIKRDLTNDLQFLSEGVKEVLPQEDTFASIELKWLVTAVSREVSLLKHHLFQLEKALEKQHNNANQSGLQHVHSQEPICTMDREQRPS